MSWVPVSASFQIFSRGRLIYGAMFPWGYLIDSARTYHHSITILGNTVLSLCEYERQFPFTHQVVQKFGMAFGNIWGYVPRLP